MIFDTAARPVWDYDLIAERLRSHGWVYLPAGLDTGLALALLQDLHRQPEPHWQQAGIGRRTDHHSNPFVRRDTTCWLTGHSDAQQRYLAATEALRLELNRRLLLGLFDYECHYARYAAGAFYRKHRDAFRGRSNRVLTSVCYLNPDWAPSDGGELVLYSPEDEEIARLQPSLGGALFFLSEDFPHEVLAAARSRYSISGWFRANNSRAEWADPAR